MWPLSWSAHTAIVVCFVLVASRVQIRCMREAATHSALFTRCGLSPTAAFLLHGLPGALIPLNRRTHTWSLRGAGSGKSLLARSVAAHSGLPVHTVVGPQVFQREEGASERTLAATFARATAGAPSIVLIEDIDALSPAGANSSDEVCDSLPFVVNARPCSALAVCWKLQRTSGAACAGRAAHTT